jgi:hypothetical protein
MATESVNGPARRSASRRLPPGVSVRSMVASRLPARSPARVRVNSRLARVAASISMVALCPSRKAATEAQAGAELGALDIGERSGGGGDLGAAEGAEGVERGDAEELLEAAFAGSGSSPSRASGVTGAATSRQNSFNSGSSWIASGQTISRGSRRASSTASPRWSVSSTAKRTPVEMSSAAMP